MAVLDGAITIGGATANAGQFSNEEKWYKVTYDFSVDTGAIADYDVLINLSAKNYVVTDFYMHAETATTSAGASVMDLGIGAGGTDFKSDLAVTAPIIGAIAGMDTVLPVRLPATTGKIVMGIEAATLTAGKLHFHFRLKQI